MKNKKLSTLFKHNRVNREVIVEVQKLLDIIKRYDLYERAYWEEYYNECLLSKSSNIKNFVESSIYILMENIEEYTELKEYYTNDYLNPILGLNIDLLENWYSKLRVIKNVEYDFTVIKGQIRKL